MAFGFPPKYVVEFPIEGYSNEQILSLGIEAAKSLNWNIGHIDESGFTAFTKMSLIAYSLEVNFSIDNGFVSMRSECSTSQIVDWGKNKRNVENFISAFDQVKLTITQDEIHQKVVALHEMIASSNSGDSGARPNKGRFNNFFAIFNPVAGYYMTPIILDLNVIVFLLMVLSGVNMLSPSYNSLIAWGANFQPLTLDGQWWRLITNVFLHIGIFHLLFNMYALVYIGILLEPILGRTRFLAAYLITGVVGSLTSVSWHYNILSAGASGAIFGMYGVFLAMLSTNLIEKSARKALLLSIGLFVGYNLVNGMKAGIDNAAHLGGLISGLLIGFAYYPSLKKQDSEKLNYGTIAVLSVLFISLSAFFYNRIPRDTEIYFKKMDSFADTEKKALQLFNLPNSTPRKELLSVIKDTGIYYWNENIKLLNEVDKLKIPADLHKRNQTLIRYCNLRVKSFELIYKAVSEDTNQYNDDIGDCNRQIEELINSLKNK